MVVAGHRTATPMAQPGRSMEKAHTIKEFDVELDQLRKMVLSAGGLVEQQIGDAIAALRTRDTAAAEQVIARDEKIDDLERDIHDHVVRMLALRNPVADDLRTVLVGLQLAQDLERIGDYAANLAKRSLVLSQSPGVPAANGLPRLVDKAQAMLRDAIDAYADADSAKALDVWRRDREIDEMHTGLFRELLTYMMEDPRSIGACTHLLFISKNVERIGDRATNIAEQVYFLVEGRQIAGERPKGGDDEYKPVVAD